MTASKAVALLLPFRKGSWPLGHPLYMWICTDTYIHAACKELHLAALLLRMHAYACTCRVASQFGAPLLAQGSQPPSHSILSSACLAYIDLIHILYNGNATQLLYTQCAKTLQTQWAKAIYTMYKSNATQSLCTRFARVAWLPS